MDSGRWSISGKWSKRCKNFGSDDNQKEWNHGHNKGRRVDPGSWISRRSAQIIRKKIIMCSCRNSFIEIKNSMPAKQTRIVTLLRWVVEAVNGRLKNMFSFFDHIIPMTSVPKLNRLLLIVVGILNAFSPPLFNETEFHDDIAERVGRTIGKENDLEAEIKSFKNTVKWLKADENSVKDFPRMVLEELKLITIGIYQINMAKNYNTNMVLQWYYNTNTNNIVILICRIIKLSGLG